MPIIVEKNYTKTEGLFLFDQEFRQNASVLAGVDEAGRGPLAGPVVCAAVVMPAEGFIEGVNDSKKLSEKRREALYEKIVECALAFSVVFVDPQEIDRINILNATKKGMEQSIGALNIKPDLVLIDAVKLPVDLPQRAIVQGDAKSYSIAAASILAKVSRDRYMRKMDQTYPQYGFAKHKGYGTKEHIEKIRQYGLCEEHRKTFALKFASPPTEEA